MKFIACLLLSGIFLTSCASMISGMSLSSLLSGRTLNVCPTERQAIVDEATENALVQLRAELQKEKYGY